jgi:hypothetical protein
LIIEPVPLITPLKVLDNEPLVNVPLPSVIDPAPPIEPTVSLKFARLNVPVTVSALSFGIQPPAPNVKVPSEIDVEPV